MTGWMTHRATVVGAAAATLGLALTGCGAGQVAQTAEVLPPVPGLNVDVEAPDGSIALRNVVVAYPGPEGYPLGEDATIELAIVNQTPGPVTLVAAGSDQAASVAVGAVAEQDPQGVVPTPTGTPGADVVEIPAAGYVSTTLLASGLTEALNGTNALPLTLTFDNGATVALDVPMATPLSPEPREPIDLDEGD